MLFKNTTIEWTRASRECALMKNNQLLLNAIDDLIVNEIMDINDDSELFFEDLSFEVKAELTRLAIEADDREVSECFLDPTVDMINDDATCALLTMLRNPSEETKENFSNIILMRSIDMHASGIQDLINERLNIRLHDVMEDNGFYRARVGYEYQWRRF